VEKKSAREFLAADGKQKHRLEQIWLRMVLKFQGGEEMKKVLPLGREAWRTEGGDREESKLDFQNLAVQAPPWKNLRIGLGGSGGRGGGLDEAVLSQA